MLFDECNMFIIHFNLQFLIPILFYANSLFIDYSFDTKIIQTVTWLVFECKMLLRLLYDISSCEYIFDSTFFNSHSSRCSCFMIKRECMSFLTFRHIDKRNETNLFVRFIVYENSFVLSHE